MYVLLHLDAFEYAFEFEEMAGNGYCTDANNGDGVARRYYSRMSHENAREICELDAKCIAYTYSPDYMSDASNSNVVMYTSNSKLCTNDCSNTQWLHNPTLIKQASNIHNYAPWRTSKCYRKKYLTNC